MLESFHWRNETAKLGLKKNERMGTATKTNK